MSDASRDPRHPRKHGAAAISTPHCRPCSTIASGDTVTLHSFPAGGRETLPPRSRPRAGGLLARTRHAGARARPALRHRPGPRARRRARRRAAGRHPRPEVPPGLGLRRDPAAARHAAGRVHRLRDHPSRHRRARGVCDPALGHGTAARSVLRHHGDGAAAGLGPGAARRCRAGSAATWTTRNCRSARRSTCRSSTRARCSIAGDGHGVQGDGEVCITALETGVTGTFRLTVRKDLRLDLALRRDAHAPDVDRPARGPRRAASAGRAGDGRHVCARTSLTRNQAYMLCSLAGNLRVTQTVDGNKGVHMLMPKSALPRESAQSPAPGR